jgi:thermostable 8-oxoguanine DNA glycosylase
MMPNNFAKDQLIEQLRESLVTQKEYYEQVLQDGGERIKQEKQRADLYLERNKQLETQKEDLLNGIAVVIERFLPCRSDFIFSKRSALDKITAMYIRHRGDDEIFT